MTALRGSLLRPTFRFGRGHLVVVTMWLLGLATLAAVLVLQGRLDQRRQAQLAVANMRLQVGVLPKTALGLAGPTGRAAVQSALDAQKQRIAATAKSLDGLAGNRTDSQLIMRELGAMYPVLGRANAMASAGHLRAATVMLGLSLLPGSPGYRLNQTFDTISARYDNEAASARDLVEIGSALAIVVLLGAFSIVLWRAGQLARQKNELLEHSRRDAVTDQLTGLWNRRKLFGDLDELLAGGVTSGEPVVLGVLDLDGFKAFNDRFGHPAGDALLARMGEGLRQVVDGCGAAYRLGGDEFCVIVRGADTRSVLERARSVLSAQADGVRVSCSLGSVPIVADGSTADELLHRADRHLYDHKRSRGGPESPPAFAA